MNERTNKSGVQVKCVRALCFIPSFDRCLMGFSRRRVVEIQNV